MSPALADSLKLAANMSTIYGGFFVFFTGVIGNVLNIITFTSLTTFRETSAAFYMTFTSSVNILQLCVSLFTRILITGYNIDLTRNSFFFCKTREYLVDALMLISFTCMCFAVIDQFFSLTDRWHHLCSLKMAIRYVIIACICWFLHGIPCILYSDYVQSPTTGAVSCAFTNRGYSLYSSRFLFPILLGFLQLGIRITFAVLAFINVRSLPHRQVPFVRVERDKQLTMMVLVEVVVDVIITVPYSIYNHLYSSNMTFTDPISIALNQFLISIIRIIFYGNFAVSFYIYCCVSSRFRKQLAYVLIEIHLKRCRQRNNPSPTNQISPQSVEINEAT